MYQEFFALKDLPFSISPDPDFLFLSDRHKEAFAHLQYGLQSSGGFVLLTGEVGTGKTTICRLLLQQLPAQLDVAFILNPALNEVELLATICDEFNIPYNPDKASLKVLFDSLAAWIKAKHEQGRRAVVVIDEAQHLSFTVLEQLRLLTNITSSNKKTLQIILIGQTELQEKLKQKALRQLAQRITARYHLLALTEKETAYYIQHRLNVAGETYPIFEPQVYKKIFKYSQGVPRLINLICDRCLLCAYSENISKVSPKILKTAVQEIDFDYHLHNDLSLAKQWGRLSVLALLILLIGMQISGSSFFPVMIDKIATVSRSSVALADSPSQVEKDVVVDAPHVATAIVPEQVNQATINAQVAVNSGQQKALWFDDYPLLDFTQGEFGYALKTLYAIWGYQVDLGGISCEQGAVVSLLCFSERSNISKLKQLNHPAIIKLANAEQSLYAVIFKISDNYQLIIGDQVVTVAASWLQRYWHGGLTLLWKTPFITDKPFKLGEKGERVTWLTGQLARIYGQPMVKKVRFDRDLEALVKQFQRDNLLIDDGIVGARTIMLIMQQTHPEFPRLSEEKL